MDIVLATRNEKKVKEIKRIIEEGGVSVTKIFTLNDFPGCPDVQEDGKTFEENAVKKAVSVSQYTGMTALADDSGLEVDVLNGAPGVLSARYAGDSADDMANLKKLLREMEHVPYEKRRARFACCIAMAYKDTVKTFFGYVKGSIGREPQGKSGFGYDPVFYPEGYDRTFAQMSNEKKNALSHRGKALREFQKYLKEKGINL